MIAQLDRTDDERDDAPDEATGAELGWDGGDVISAELAATEHGWWAHARCNDGGGQLNELFFSDELQDIALSMKGVNEAYAIQAGREVRVMVDAAKVGDDEAHLIARDIAKRVSEQMTFPGEIKVTVLRETRAIEYAR